MKIVMLATRSGDGGIADPTAVLCASRVALYSGHDIRVVQAVKGGDISIDLVKELKHADVLGVSCITSSCISEGIQASKLFKLIRPTGKVVWGGWHASLLPGQVLEMDAIDAVVIGQGERSFAEMWEKKWDDVPGLCFKSNGKIVRNPPRKLEDVNNFPAIPYHLVDIERNLRTTIYGKRTIRYNSSQGCPHRCGFCVEPTLYHRKWSGLNAKRVVDEIEMLVSKYGVDSVIFTDSNFFVDPERVRSICRLIIDRGLKIKWGDANGRTRQMLGMFDSTWELMEKSGCKGILVGAESAMQEGLDALHKDTTVEETVELVFKANSHGIGVVCSMMVGIPYPNKTVDELHSIARQEFKSNCDLIKKIYRIGNTQNQAMIFSFTPYPGTELWPVSLKLGAREPKSLEEWSKFDLSHNYSEWIPKDVAAQAAMVTEYVLPWIEGLFLVQLKGKPLLYAIGWIIKTICKLRWNLRFFRFGADHWLYRQVLKYWSPK